MLTRLLELPRTEMYKDVNSSRHKEIIHGARARGSCLAYKCLIVIDCVYVLERDTGVQHQSDADIF